MSMFTIFESVGVLFEGAFSLWVSLNQDTYKFKTFKGNTVIQFDHC